VIAAASNDNGNDKISNDNSNARQLFAVAALQTSSTHQSLTVYSSRVHSVLATLDVLMPFTAGDGREHGQHTRCVGHAAGHHP
jgi:hypothetical protein